MQKVPTIQTIAIGGYKADNSLINSSDIQATPTEK